MAHDAMHIAYAPAAYYRPWRAVPAWLSARLSLPFAPMAGDTLRPLPRERIDLDLFWTAVTYVEKLS